MPIFPAGYPEKTSNSDEDRFLISDSTDSNKIKGTKWSTIKSSIRSYVEGFTDWITTSMIQNGAVTPDNLLAGTGSSWDWGSWEPVVAGGGGLGVAVTTLFFAEYKVIGKTCFYRFRATLSLSGTAHNEITISLPVPRENPGVTATIGSGYIIGGGVDGSACFVYSSQATNLVVRLYNSSVHTTGTGRQINITGFYPAA